MNLRNERAGGLNVVATRNNIVSDICIGGFGEKE